MSHLYESIHFKSHGRATTNASKPEVIERLRSIVGTENVIVEPDRVEPYGADAVKEKFPPEAVVFPATTAEMVAIVELANEHDFPITARGGGVGYTGGAVPIEGGIVIGTDSMNRIIEINADDLYCVCQPGITTFALQQEVEKHGENRFVPGLRHLGLADDGVKWIYDDNNKALVPDAVKARVDSLQAEIVAGRIAVRRVSSRRRERTVRVRVLRRNVGNRSHGAY